jgi:hypothetical protein
VLLVVTVLSPQIRHGVLGFEMEQLLPPEIGASLADLQQQGDSDGASDVDSVVSGSELSSQLRSAGQLGDRAHFKEAADRIRDKIAAGRHKVWWGVSLCSCMLAFKLDSWRQCFKLQAQSVTGHYDPGVHSRLSWWLVEFTVTHDLTQEPSAV